MKLWPFAFLAILFSCHQSKDPRDLLYSLNIEQFSAGNPIAIIKDRRIIEASGLAYSVKNPGHLWTHNDSGGQPSIYLLDTSGQIRQTIYLSGAINYDWEDITSDGEHLYIADIGDNRAEREHITIYMLEEPILTSVDSIAVNSWLEMKLRYANGPRDAETLMYDYQTNQLVLVSKRDESCFVYTFPFASSSELTLKPTAQINLRMFTAGDINQQGDMILKNYDEIFYWNASKQTLADKFLIGPDFRVPYIAEPQGEAITFAPDGSFFTLSEFNSHSKQQIYYYQLLRQP